jgi:hypothetical protein
MTSQEILANRDMDNQTPVQAQTRWLHEIAYQLAVMNERDGSTPTWYEPGVIGLCRNCGQNWDYHADANGLCRK